MKTLDRLNEDWRLATEIHKIEARLWRKAKKDRIQVIMITSAARGEGKSTTVAYLATALALHPGRRILVVDLDFRDPQLNSHFELDVARGFGAVLRGECPLQDAIIKTDLPNLDLILPSPDGDDPGLLLETLEFPGVFDSFRKDYDLVLMDVPAMIPVADASTLLPLVDGVILMAMAGRTTKPQLHRAREICMGMEANILGLIIGNLQDGMPGYANAGYYYAYKREEPTGGGNGDPKDQE